MINYIKRISIKVDEYFGIDWRNHRKMGAIKGNTKTSARQQCRTKNKAKIKFYVF